MRFQSITKWFSTGLYIRWFSKGLMVLYGTMAYRTSLDIMIIFNVFIRKNDKTLYFDLLIIYLMNNEIDTCIFGGISRLYIRLYSVACDSYIHSTKLLKIKTTN